MRRERLVDANFEGNDYYRSFDLLIDSTGKEWSGASILLTLAGWGRLRNYRAATSLVWQPLLEVHEVGAASNFTPRRSSERVLERVWL